MSTLSDDLGRDILSALVTVVREWTHVGTQTDDTALPGVAIPTGEIRLMYLLGSHPEPLTPGAIADNMGISRPALSKSLGLLREAGLITHEQAPGDRRSVYVLLTASGRDAYSWLMGLGVDLLRRAAAGMPEGEVAAVAGFLGRLAAEVGTTPPVVLPQTAVIRARGVGRTL